MRNRIIAVFAILGYLAVGSLAFGQSMRPLQIQGSGTSIGQAEPIFWTNPVNRAAMINGLPAAAPLVWNSGTLTVANSGTGNTGVLALATDAEIQTGTNNNKAVPPSGLAAWWAVIWAAVKNSAQTIAGAWNFTTAPTISVSPSGPATALKVSSGGTDILEFQSWDAGGGLEFGTFVARYSGTTMNGGFGTMTASGSSLKSLLSDTYLGFGPGSATRDIFIVRTGSGALRIGSAADGSGSSSLRIGDLTADGPILAPNATLASPNSVGKRDLNDARYIAQRMIFNGAEQWECRSTADAPAAVITNAINERWSRQVVQWDELSTKYLHFPIPSYWRTVGRTSCTVEVVITNNANSSGSTGTVAFEATHQRRGINSGSASLAAGTITVGSASTSMAGDGTNRAERYSITVPLNAASPSGSELLENIEFRRHSSNAGDTLNGAVYTALITIYPN